MRTTSLLQSDAMKKFLQLYPPTHISRPSVFLQGGGTKDLGGERNHGPSDGDVGIEKKQLSKL